MGEPFEKKYVQFSEDDRKKVTDNFHNWQQVGFEKKYKNTAEFCYSAKFEEVEKKDFSLVPSKYIEFVNRDENIDFDEKMQTLKSEFVDLLKAETTSTNDLLTVFKDLGYEIKL